MQPARIVAGLGQPGETPPGGRFVKSLPRPFHDHRRAAGNQRGMHLVEHLVEVGHVVQRRARDDRVDRAAQVTVLERGLTVGRPRRRFRVDPGRLVSGLL
jgi:hypothetical protein